MLGCRREDLGHATPKLCQIAALIDLTEFGPGKEGTMRISPATSPHEAPTKKTHLTTREVPFRQPFTGPKPIPTTDPAKVTALKDLGRLRHGTTYPGFRNIWEFHDGRGETEWVSPYTNSAHNTKSEIILV